MGQPAECIGGEFLMANEYLVNSDDLTAVADAIRAKGGTSDALTFPGGFVDAVGAIQAGGDGISLNLDDVHCAIIDFVYDADLLTIYDGTIYQTRRTIVS